MSEIKYGWRKDKFDDEAVYHVRKMVKIPESASLSAFIPQIGDQDGVGACVGFGFAGETSTVAAQLGIIAPHLSLYHSANWIYNGARKTRGWLNEDTGAYPDDAANFIVEKSLVKWLDWPFKNKLDTTDPDVYANKAIGYLNRSKVRVDNGVDGILSALAEGHPIAIGTPWFNIWQNYSSGILPKIDASSTIAGGHETFLWGYDLAKGIAYGSNSWGAGWGIAVDGLDTRGGYAMYLDSFEMMKKYHGGYDAHYIILEKPNEPSPDAELYAITVSPESDIITVGNKRSYMAVGKYTDGGESNITDKVEWWSSNENVASVEAGIASGNTTGITKIYATSENIQSNMASLKVIPSESDCPWGKKYAKIASIPFVVAGRRGRCLYMNTK